MKTKKLKFVLLNGGRVFYFDRHNQATSRKHKYLLKNLNNGQIIGFDTKQLAFDFSKFCGADLEILSKL